MDHSARSFVSLLNVAVLAAATFLAVAAQAGPRDPVIVAVGDLACQALTQGQGEGACRSGEIVIGGHNHLYQRWAPQDAHGNAASDGVVQFTVGTGGRSLYPYGFGSVPENLVATQNKSFGLLKLTLHRDSYDYEWVTLPGDAPFTDADASVSCH